MVKICVTLSEVEAACLEELAREAGISVEEAARRAIRHVLREVASVNPQFYQNFRSQMFWEHYRHLNQILNRR